MATSSVCGCFGNLRPRYKRLVDNIFPSDPNDEIVKTNMEILTFYALQAPEKLDRIGDYMYMKINNHLYRKRIGFVYIAMVGMDHLLLACRSSSLNLFVESFLKIVSTLLESSEARLQICATNSFVKFANIDEDTPSYHRRYEFFISRFSQLCYGNNDDPETEKKIRLSGLQGLQGVVRKTVNDDLQANIWDELHMSKIVPALLFNIESNSEEVLRMSTASMSVEVDTNNDQNDDPSHLADLCLRELVKRAGFNNIEAVLYPLLTFMDSRSLWLKNEFPLHIFKIIMYSIQNQYSYRAIELLLSHLDKHKNSEAEMRASVVEMISASVSIATGGSIGPAILEVFNTLLKHLKISVDFMCDDSTKKVKVDKITEHKEMLVQSAIINAAGAFSSILAGYQRVDVMLFIIMKIPHLNMSEDQKKHADAEDEIGNIDPQEELEQLNLMKCLLQVAESHNTKQFSSTFSSKLMDAVLTGLLLKSPDVRFYVQKLLITLLDRHDNLKKLERLHSYTAVGEHSFDIEKCSRQDSAFLKKNSQYFYFHLYQSCHRLDNRPSNIRLLTNIICLLVLEFGEEDNIVQMVGFVLGIQNHARSKDSKLSSTQKSCLHALSVVFFLLISDLTTVTSLLHHCEEVIAKRESEASWLLPINAFGEEKLQIDEDKFSKLDDSLFFDRRTIVNALKSNNYETSSIETPYEPKPAVRTTSATSITEHFPIVKADSNLSVGSSVYRILLGPVVRTRIKLLIKSDFNLSELISNQSGWLNGPYELWDDKKEVEAPVQRITYEDLKDAIRGEKSDVSDGILNFEKASFQDIAAYNEKANVELHSKLKKAIDVACRASQAPKHPELSKDLFEMEFPSLYVY